MTKINVYGPEGQILDSVDLSQQPNYNDPTCRHPNVVTVEDNSGIENVVAKQCRNCNVGWLTKLSKNEEK